MTAERASKRRRTNATDPKLLGDQETSVDSRTSSASRARLTGKPALSTESQPESRSAMDTSINGGLGASMKSKVKSKSTKSKKTSDAGPISTPDPGTIPQKHVLFKQRAVSKGVEIHPSITPAALPGRGVGLQTTAAIPKKTRILFIPEKAIFKPRAEDAKGRPNLSPHAHLALSAFRNFADNEELGPWKDSWPTSQDLLPSLPLFWRQNLRDELPLSTKAILDRQIHDFETDKTSAGTTQDPSFDYYWAIVNSRSFHWKPPGSKPGYMVLCPFIDYLNHGPQGTGLDVHQTKKGFEVWTDRDYAAGEEPVFTYGAHSNDKLLVHYGFLPSSSPPQNAIEAALNDPIPSDDSINLDHILLPNFSSAVKSTLQDTGYLGNYSYIPTEGVFCFRTQVAIRAQLFSANEWEFFYLNGVDMGVDREREVKEWLQGPLEDYLAEVRERLHRYENWWVEKGEEAALEVIKERWKQIEEGVCKALGFTVPVGRFG